MNNAKTKALANYLFRVPPRSSSALHNQGIHKIKKRFLTFLKKCLRILWQSSFLSSVVEFLRTMSHKLFIVILCHCIEVLRNSRSDSIRNNRSCFALGMVNMFIHCHSFSMDLESQGDLLDHRIYSCQNQRCWLLTMHSLILLHENYFHVHYSPCEECLAFPLVGYSREARRRPFKCQKISSMELNFKHVSSLPKFPYSNAE
jgi:hypothetical protein